MQLSARIALRIAQPKLRQNFYQLMKPFSPTPEEKSVVVDLSTKATESEDIRVENGLKSQSYNHTNTDVMSKKQDTTSVEPAVGDFWNLSEVHSWTDEKLTQNLTVLLEEKKRRDLNRTWKIQMSEIHKAQVQAQVQAQTALLPQQSMVAGGQIAPELTVYDHHKYHHQQHIQPLSFAQQNDINGKLAEGKGIVPPTGNGGLQHPLGNTPIAAPPQVGFSGSNIGTKMTPLTSQSQLSGYHEFGADVLKALDSTSTPKITHMLAPNFMKTEGALLVSKPEGGKPKRKPLRPGLTASNRERQFVNHDYQDHYMEEPSNHEANLDMFYETKATIDGPATVKPIESVQRLAFPLKLHLGLTAIEDAGLTHIISWQPHGRAVLIHKPKEFEDEVMETYFAMKKLTSFQRQLNLYGFRRITCGADAGSYYVSATYIPVIYLNIMLTYENNFFIISMNCFYEGKHFYAEGKLLFCFKEYFHSVYKLFIFTWYKLGCNASK